MGQLINVGETMDILIWIFIAIVFIALELITGSFFLVWLGFSALVSALLNYLGFDVYVQFGSFVVISLILILLTRKFAVRITPEPSKKTTADRLIGKKGIVIKKLKDNNLIVKVSGEEWSAISDSQLDVGDEVKVAAIESIKLIVEKYVKGD